MSQIDSVVSEEDVVFIRESITSLHVRVCEISSDLKRLDNRLEERNTKYEKIAEYCALTLTTASLCYLSYKCLDLIISNS